MDPNVGTQLQVLVAGENADPGRPPYDGAGGRTGQPDVDVNPVNGQTSFPAGVTFPVISSSPL